MLIRTVTQTIMVVGSAVDVAMGLNVVICSRGETGAEVGVPMPQVVMSLIIFRHRRRALVELSEDFSDVIHLLDEGIVAVDGLIGAMHQTQDCKPLSIWKSRPTEHIQRCHLALKGKYLLP